ncbi:MAG: hypothetical protein QOJ65_2006 [Fimbriimonadaceae bacterium]|jgi:probable phosphoglycerate mutase|nr:hypothetical protein [Fimbriimonadaceae bacterium]
MTTVLLIRHGDHDLLNRAIAGRMPSVHLNASGIEQVEKLAGTLSSLPIRAVFTSPLERALESAEPLAKHLSLELQVSDQISEVDFGEWTGWTFHQLHGNPEWKRFNEYRSGSRVPGGESMQEIQARMMDFLERMRVEYPDAVVAAFGHGDPIKMALMHCLAVPIDFLHRIEISTGSVSAIQVSEAPARVLCLNWTPGLPTIEGR